MDVEHPIEHAMQAETLPAPRPHYDQNYVGDNWKFERVELEDQPGVFRMRIVPLAEGEEPPVLQSAEDYLREQLALKGMAYETGPLEPDITKMTETAKIEMKPFRSEAVHDLKFVPVSRSGTTNSKRKPEGEGTISAKQNEVAACCCKDVVLYVETTLFGESTLRVRSISNENDKCEISIPYCIPMQELRERMFPASLWSEGGRFLVAMAFNDSKKLVVVEGDLASNAKYMEHVLKKRVYQVVCGEGIVVSVWKDDPLNFSIYTVCADTEVYQGFVSAIDECVNIGSTEQPIVLQNRSILAVDYKEGFIVFLAFATYIEVIDEQPVQRGTYAVIIEDKDNPGGQYIPFLYDIDESEEAMLFASREFEEKGIATNFFISLDRSSEKSVVFGTTKILHCITNLTHSYDDSGPLHMKMNLFDLPFADFTKTVCLGKTAYIPCKDSIVSVNMDTGEKKEKRQSKGLFTQNIIRSIDAYTDSKNHIFLSMFTSNNLSKIEREEEESENEDEPRDSEQQCQERKKLRPKAKRCPPPPLPSPPHQPPEVHEQAFPPSQDTFCLPSADQGQAVMEEGEQAQAFTAFPPQPVSDMQTEM